MPILLDSVSEFPLPRMSAVRQTVMTDVVRDLEGDLSGQMERHEIRTALAPGQRVAVAVGSRGIRNLSAIVKCTVDKLRGWGAAPFVVSAMGSHGGGTEDGQRQVLAGYGITEELLGVPVVTTVETRLLGRARDGTEVYFDEAALGADAIIPINRVKLHTDFMGPLQSGLCKMLVIGLGNHKGCSRIHENPVSEMSRIIESCAELILSSAPVAFGIAVVENGRDETCHIEAVPRDVMIRREKELLAVAERNMPSLMIPEMDVLVVEEIGKDISGAGFDPNIIGRSSLRSEYSRPVPSIQKMVVLGVTPASHGNAAGIGLFDVTTKAAMAAVDWEATYANAVAAKCPEDVKIPLVAENEEQALRIALHCCRSVDMRRPRIVRIKNTLEMEQILVSEALLDYVERDDRLAIVQDGSSRCCR